MPTTNGAAAPNAEGLLGEAAWRTAVSRFLKGASVDTLTTRTRDGIAIAPLYPASDVPGEPALRRQPGAIDIVQRIDHPDPVEAGRQARTDAANGATALTLVFAGARSASPFGLPIDLDLDIAPLFDGLDPARIAVRLELPGSGCEDVLDRALGAAERQGFVRTNPAFEVAADLLGDTAFKAVPSAGTQALAGAASHWLRALGNRGLTGPAFRADGRPYHEAGGSEAQELASLLATGVFYLRVLERAGQDSPVRFTLASDADQLLTIAKFRALRRLWARVERACGRTPRPIRLHGETARRMLARMDCWTNLLRTTIACANAIIGGADSVTVLPFTTALGLPDTFARRLARNTALVLIEEAHLGRVADPGAGTGTFEALTEDLCCEAWRLFQGIEADGGMAAVLETGAWQREIAVAREKRRAAFQTGETQIVGITRFINPDDRRPSVLMPLPENASGGGLPSWRDAEAFEVEGAP